MASFENMARFHRRKLASWIAGISTCKLLVEEAAISGRLINNSASKEFFIGHAVTGDRRMLSGAHSKCLEDPAMVSSVLTHFGLCCTNAESQP